MRMMGSESLVYGCIRDMSFGDGDNRHENNCCALQTLPERDGYPLLSREMFALPMQDDELGCQVVHFGACYRGVEYEWAQWLLRFETLLKKMYWVSATVQLETELYGVHSFNWQVEGDFHAPGDNDLRLQCEWSRESLSL
ncbi:hypothetical protein ACVBEJ_09785 [Porticoccus sp. GXU_MW_L64]